MRGRGRELRYEHVAVVTAKHLRLRAVRKRIEVKPVGRCAVRLVARSDVACMAPFDPLRENVVDDQVRKRLAVVALEPRNVVRIALSSGKRLPTVFQVVAALRPERLEKARRPPGSVVLERIMVHAQRTDCSRTVESLDKRTQKGIHGLLRQDHPGALVLEPFYYCRDMVEIVHDDFNTTQWISSLFVFLVLLFAFRNLITALIAFLPMFLSWYVLQGIMALLGLEFNLINIVISTFIFGIGVDYSIFVMEGLLTEARTGQRDKLEYHKVAIVFSALVLAIVVLSLIFARHPAIRSIGIITLIGMAITILLTYSLEPFIFRQLLKWDRYRKSIRA